MGLCDPKQMQYDEDHCDDNQNMDPTSESREAWADVPTEKAEQPQYDQNYDDSPQHEISPF
jgi:hypothetical protein